MSLGGIKKRSVNDTVGHRLNPDIGRRVYTNDKNIVAAMLAGNLRSADSHAVVMGINQVDIVVYTQQRIDYRHGILFVPVAGHACEHLSAVTFKFPDKSVVPPLGRS